MPFSATVYNVLIASPSDVPDERAAIAQSLHDWNSLNAQDQGVVLQPVMWETHSTPAMGDRPQGLINNQVVRGCDMLIGALLLDRLQDESSMILDLCRSTVAASDLCRWRTMGEHQLPPADRACRTNPEPPGCLSARQPAFDSSNDTVPQITR